MPRGIGQVLVTAFGSTEGGESSHASDALGGMTTETVFKRLHPKMQDFLANIPGLKKEWEESINSGFLEMKTKGPDEVKRMKDILENNLNELNKQVDANPRALEEASNVFMSNGQQAMAMPVVLPPTEIHRKASLAAFL
mmetsp:Transcript_54685/g.97566  ORF Transcript_54685/g.97566 Transcript_54685/m.97566 type:complete len:139 (+) Transcript_54685:49-465(+)|eukprot:CAMPEP_0197622368 /NCGR_PEP_ID=MMETSP1338-20131121/2716_1 /TAXON_ID=43686 ORGANISM="Pelagodinium beii, Strain RCC1491" /NCGR_SAMPLE_ID=MMETSP1338 /ASSEMBLY_ACC=CAM_ASM_000754 /LENGTH=138 /DNA_ID=CAMNT_0043192099 /DNA_START=42 /DNA_END=458 /DNA_ORIENTATION=+